MLEKAKNFYLLNFFSINFLIILLFINFYLVLTRIWIGEDAFIFFRYVRNFVNGNGLVFNVGERIEGFTSPLWVFVLSLGAIVTQIPLRQLAMLLGILFSSLTVLAIIAPRVKKGNILFPIGLALLISNSAFRDFSTSGFETSLALFLLSVNLIFLKYSLTVKHPLLSGSLVSLLILARPEAMIVLLFLLLEFLWELVKSRKILNLVKFLVWPIVLVGGYQIFRMGYYASLFPNTYFAKRGGEFYFTQGSFYLSDFFNSYPFSIVFLLSVCAFIFLNKILKIYNDRFFANRLKILFISILFALYVLYSGGDYMHGRSLLMFYISLIIATDDVLEMTLNQKLGAVYKKVLVSVLGVILLIYIGTSTLPITSKARKEINNINDERLHFNFEKIPKGGFKEYLAEEITGQYHWRDRGFYYRDVAEATGERILVNMPNIGFFGYAAGENVDVMGTSLIDYVQARLPLKKRGKIGHEDEARWDYFFTRNPTFSYTPYVQWNSGAQFRYEDSNYAFIIKDDSDDSFIPLLDLSNKTFLEKFSQLVGVNVKEAIDTNQREFLTNLTKDSFINDLKLFEYFGFLKHYWVPYADSSDKELFNQKANEIFGQVPENTLYDVYILENLPKDKEIAVRIESKVNTKLFIDNILYTLRL